MPLMPASGGGAGGSTANAVAGKTASGGNGNSQGGTSSTSGGRTQCRGELQVSPPEEVEFQRWK